MFGQKQGSFTTALSKFCSLAWIAMAVAATTGCSTGTGFTLWPNQYPLLPQAKEFASRAAVPSSLATEKCKTVVADYFVEPGDSLQIEPTEPSTDVRLPSDQRVMVDGTIDLGEFGRLLVSGMTVEQIETAITARIGNLKNKNVTINVRLLETNAALVYVLGEVGSPAAYPIAGRETVLDAILAAGGLTSRADPCDIILVRPTQPCDCRVVMPVCYRELTQLGDTSTNYQLQPGDRIVVGSRTFCEELQFWKSNRGCDRCCNSRCAERNPSRADYLNPFCRLPSGPVLPWAQGNESDNVMPPPAEKAQPNKSPEVGSGLPSVETDTIVKPDGRTQPVHFRLQ
ncbi:MAG: polysaccharide biosynthesis/export family protein [Pirellulales bacterium]